MKRWKTDHDYIYLLQFFCLIAIVSLLFADTSYSGIISKDSLYYNTDPGEIYDRSIALLIGVKDYDSWPDLRNTVKDIKAVDELLQSIGFETTVISDITPDRPTRENIEAYLKAIHFEAGENDRLLIYFAGHGYSNRRIDGNYDGYLVPINAKGSDWTTMVNLATVQHYAESSKAKHILYLFDCIVGGLFVDVSRSMPKFSPELQKSFNEPVRMVISAGSYDEVASDGWHHSPFCESFLEFFRVPAADINVDGYLTGTELSLFISERVTSFSGDTQHPQFGKMKAFKKGEFILSRADSSTLGSMTFYSTHEQPINVRISSLSYRYTLTNNAPLEVKLPQNKYIFIFETEGWKIEKDFIIEADTELKCEITVPKFVLKPIR